MYFPPHSQETQSVTITIEGILRNLSILRLPMIVDSATNSKLLYLICQLNYPHITRTFVCSKCS